MKQPTLTLTQNELMRFVRIKLSVIETLIELEATQEELEKEAFDLIKLVTTRKIESL